jgi:hypothetical protein
MTPYTRAHRKQTVLLTHANYLSKLYQVSQSLYETEYLDLTLLDFLWISNLSFFFSFQFLLRRCADCPPQQLQLINQCAVVQATQPQQLQLIKRCAAVQAFSPNNSSHSNDPCAVLLSKLSTPAAPAILIFP